MGKRDGPADKTVVPHPNSELGLHCIRVLDALYTARSPYPWPHEDKRRPGDDEVSLRACLPVLGLDPGLNRHEVPTWLEESLVMLEGAGLISLTRSYPLPEWDVLVTHRGDLDVVQRKARRANRLHRDTVCRQNLLRWLYDFHHDLLYRPEPQVIFSSPWGTVEGDPFTVREITAALKYLEGKGLIETQPLKLTPAGIDIVNHGGSMPNDQSDAPVSITNNFNGRIGNFQGSGTKIVKQ